MPELRTDAVEAALLTILRERGVATDGVDRAADLRRQGIVDSLGIVDLVLAIERRWSCQVPADLLSTAQACSVDALAEAIVHQVTAQTATTPPRTLTLGTMTACVLDEVLRIEPRPGGYDGFLDVLRANSAVPISLRRVPHRRILWTETEDAPPPGAAPEGQRDRTWQPQVFHGCDAIVTDLVHESYLWTPRSEYIDDEAWLRRPLAARRDGRRFDGRAWLNTDAVIGGPVRLTDLRTALRRGLEALGAIGCPVILCGGLWGRPRTQFTTDYTGSAFDSALRRYLMSCGVTSPEAFYARLQAIDSIGAGVAEELGVRWLDGTVVRAQAGESAFTDPIHMNDVGWSILGPALVQTLGDVGAIDLAAPVAPFASGQPMTSIGARAAIGAAQVRDAARTPIVLQDVCSLEVDVCRLSSAMAAALEEMARYLRGCSGEAVALWGLGAAGDRLDRVCREAGATSHVFDGVTLGRSDAPNGRFDVVVCGHRGSAAEAAWIVGQVDASENSSEEVRWFDLRDWPGAFAAGAAGSDVERLRLLRVIDLIEDAAARVPAVHLVGGIADVRHALARGILGRLDRRVRCWTEEQLDANGGPAGTNAGEGVIIPVGPAAVAWCDDHPVPGCEVLDPSVHRCRSRERTENAQHVNA